MIGIKLRKNKLIQLMQNIGLKYKIAQFGVIFYSLSTNNLCFSDNSSLDLLPL